MACTVTEKLAEESRVLAASGLLSWVPSPLMAEVAALSLGREMVKLRRTEAAVTSRETASAPTPAAAATLARIEERTLGV